MVTRDLPDLPDLPDLLDLPDLPEAQEKVHNPARNDEYD